MALTPNQFLQNLLQTITNYYTATHSSDTDLYKILQMYSNELSSGSIALDTVRYNTFVETCEASKLFDNFGVFFDVTKFKDQSYFEDRYILVSGSVTKTAPTIYEDVGYWRYVYPGTMASRSVTQPTVIPGYGKQLQFLMEGAMYGDTVEGIKRAVQGFTLINPDIRETTRLPGWKLKSRSGPVAQIANDMWKFNDHYIHGLDTLPETIGHWKFEENVEELQNAGQLYGYYGEGVLLDVSGHSQHLTNFGLNSNNYVDGYTELSGSHTAISLDNTGDYVYRSSADAITFDMASENFTVEVIFKLSTTPSVNGVVIEKGVWADTQGWYLEFKTTGGLQLYLADGTNGVYIGTTTIVADNIWHYVAITVDRINDLGKLYIDGGLDNTVDISTVTGSISYASRNFTIGAYVDGLLDEICISKQRILTLSEINSRWITMKSSHNILRSGDPLRSSKWRGSHVTFYSGSISTNKIVAEYMIGAGFPNSIVTVNPIYNDYLLWDLNRIES